MRRKVTTLSLSDMEHRWLETWAYDDDVSMAAMVRRLIVREARRRGELDAAQWRASGNTREHASQPAAEEAGR